MTSYIRNFQKILKEFYPLNNNSNKPVYELLDLEGYCTSMAYGDSYEQMEACLENLIIQFPNYKGSYMLTVYDGSDHVNIIAFKDGNCKELLEWFRRKEKIFKNEEN